MKQFAESLGVTFQSIQDKIASGFFSRDIFVTVQGKVHPLIDLELATKLYKERIDLGQQISYRAGANKVNMAPTKVEAQLLPEGGKTEGRKVKIESPSPETPIKKDAAPSDDNPFERLQKAKATHEQLKLELTEKKLMEMRGELILVSTVQSTLSELLSKTREALMNIPDQVGPSLFACDDLFTLQERLRLAINKTLEELQKLEGMYAPDNGK